MTKRARCRLELGFDVGIKLGLLLKSSYRIRVLMLAHFIVSRARCLVLDGCFYQLGGPVCGYPYNKSRTI